MALNSAINTGALGAGFIFGDGAGTLTTTSGIKITKYTANDTWTKDARTTMISIISWNAGGGGGSGRRGATTAAGGGGGGVAGGVLYYTSLATFFNSTETVTIGGTGTGGPTQTSDNTNGSTGSNGGVTSIGNVYVSLLSNNRGAGGTTTTAATGAAQVGIQGYAYYGVTYQVGGAGSNAASSNAVSQSNTGSGLELSAINPLTILWPGNGAGGSGADTTTARQAGNGGNTYSWCTTSNLGTIINAGGAGGIETGTVAGGDGQPFISTTGGRMVAASGGGGGGGMKASPPGAGGKGGLPGGGGGGGGGSINGTNSGAGGDGGRGELWVIEYF